MALGAPANNRLLHRYAYRYRHEAGSAGDQDAPQDLSQPLQQGVVVRGALRTVPVHAIAFLFSIRVCQ